MASVPLSIIVATDRRRAIGYQNRLLWHIPEEMAHFKRVTQGKPVIMGRKTYESIGRPLPNRYNLVVSSKPIFRKGVSWCNTLEKAISRAEVWARNHQCSEVMVIGGSAIYQQCLPKASTIYMTVVDMECGQVDAWFPKLPPGWAVASRQYHAPKGNHSFYIKRYQRRLSRHHPQNQLTFEDTDP